MYVNPSTANNEPPLGHSYRALSIYVSLGLGVELPYIYKDAYIWERLRLAFPYHINR